jgi:hypothetical protein
MVFNLFDTRICVCPSTLQGFSVQSVRLRERIECMVYSVYDTRCHFTIPEEKGFEIQLEEPQSADIRD